MVAVVEADGDDVFEEVVDTALWPFTVIVRPAVLVEPVTGFPDCRSLVFQMKDPMLRSYCCGEVKVTVKEADSVPDVVAGTIAHMADPA